MINRAPQTLKSRHCHMNATLVAPEARGCSELGALGAQASRLGAWGLGLVARGLWPEACDPVFRTRGSELASQGWGLAAMIDRATTLMRLKKSVIMLARN